jgi:hypothetical protein
MEDIHFAIQMFVDLARARISPLKWILVAGPFPWLLLGEAFAHRVPSFHLCVDDTARFLYPSADQSQLFAHLFERAERFV